MQRPVRCGALNDLFRREEFLNQGNRLRKFKLKLPGADAAQAVVDDQLELGCPSAGVFEPDDV